MHTTDCSFSLISRIPARARRLGFAAAVAICAGPALAATPGPLVQISGVSPFLPLQDCGNFPGNFNGVNYVDSEVEPWLEVNPANASNIVAVWQQDRWSDGGSRGNVAGVTLDGGTNWVVVPIQGLTDCSGGPWERASDPWVSFGPTGTLHQMTLAFQADPPADRVGGFGPNAMLASRSTDGGLTWSAPATLIEDDDPRVLNDKNSLTADPVDAGYVYAVWDRLKITSGDAIDPENVRPGIGNAFGVRFGLGYKGPVYFARSTDDGASWEPARKIYDPGANNQTINNQIVVSPEGRLIDFFTEILNYRNSDGGAQFEANLAFLWSDDKGETWQPRGKPVRIAKIISSGAVTPDGFPVRDASILFDVAVGADGNLFAVWQDTRFNGVEQVAFSMSTDGGFTWSSPIKVSQTPDNAAILRTQAFLPSVAVSAGGVVSVTYYDFRNDDDGASALADYFVVQCDTSPPGSCAEPANWAGNETRLTDASFDYNQAPVARGLFLGDYQGLASDGDDIVSAFGIAGGGDAASIYFRRVSP